MKTETSEADVKDSRARMRALMLGALGVVFGDIGTSPLYAIRECFNPAHGMPLSESNILGILSLVFWSLVLVVSIKYLRFVLRADNQGEGGILALLARLLSGTSPRSPRLTSLLIALGLCGASLLAADGMITPAISVLSAIEGIEVATPVFKPFVVPITCVILISLFVVQRHGTAKIGGVFGPIMLVWFSTIGVLGLTWICAAPEILSALNPLHAVRFFMENGPSGLLVMGAVVLCVTGCEALYADMGHFGREPLTRTWRLIVFPAIALNYFGQGAILLIRGDAAVANPFYEMVPEMMLYPMVGLATAATVIASQALISGMYSLSWQAVQLDFVPRIRVVHTSADMESQIYVPFINYLFMCGCVGLVLGFKDSSSLAAAYGVSVIGTMIITSILMMAVEREQWQWSVLKVAALSALFLALDFIFLAGNLTKLAHGGWFPLAAGGLFFIVSDTWRRGKGLMSRMLVSRGIALEDFVGPISREEVHRVPGVAVFLMPLPDMTPRVFMHHLKHNKILHEMVVLFSLVLEHVPSVPQADQVSVRKLADGIHLVTARYGFMQSLDIRKLLETAQKSGLPAIKGEASYYMGRTTIRVGGKTRLWRWQKMLFAFLFHNEPSPADQLDIPPNRVVETGEHAEI